MASRRRTPLLNTVYTVGHSTRSAPQLLEILRDAQVDVVADVRAFPSSRRHPQFNRDALANWLPEAGIEYVHMPALGGRRTPRTPSPNQGWRERGFRGYADYMATAAFWTALGTLERQAASRTTAIMCAEALWWRCHRRLISDALSARGWDVEHLGTGSAQQRHELTSFAHRGEDGVITYPSEQLSLELTNKED
jgi:uncharacterized protein (DUF488 family)